MFPLRDENPHPPGFKPKVTIALIIVNVIVFFMEVAYTGQFFDFSNQNAFAMFYNWGAVPACVTGAYSGVDTGNGIVQCPAFSEITLLTSTFMHGGLLHLGGNIWFLWIFGDNIEQKFGKVISENAGHCTIPLPVSTPLYAPVTQAGTAPQL